MNTQPDWQTLVDVPTLARARAADGGRAICVVDCRAVLSAPETAARQYAEGHIPGARRADLERDLSDMRLAGQGRHPWPAVGQFAAVLARLGIGADTQVVAYDADTGMFAARLWWMLHLLGHRQVAVLDGGLAAWQAAGLPLAQGEDETETGDETRVPPAGARPREFDYSRLMGHEDVAAHLAHGGLLVDARMPERFRGEVEPLDAKAGHVPGAVNRPFAANIGADGRFKPAGQLYQEFAALLHGRTPSDMVVMCGSGVTACHHLLAMAHAGLSGSKLYTGSWSGWIADPQRPLAQGG